MRDTHDSDSTDLDPGRRRVLAALGTAGVGLAGFGRVGARTASGSAGGTAPSSTQLSFAGFQHAALGEAGLDVEGGSLRVETGGDGGVAVDVGEAESFITETGFDGGVEPGSYREFRGYGVVDGDPGQPVGLARITRTDGPHAFELAPDFGPIGADGYDLEVYSQGELVHQGGTYYTPNPLDPPTPEFVDYVFEWVWTGAGWMLVIRIVIDIPIFPPDEEEGVLGDEIRVTPAESAVQPGPVTDVDVLAAGRPDFTVRGEAVGVLGRDHRQVGSARLHPVDGGTALGVDGLGEGGDGVAAAFDAAEGIELALDGAEVAAEGANLSGLLRGRVDGTPATRAGRVSLFGDGDVVAVDADFTPLGTDGVQVLVLDGGDVVGEATVPAGRVAYLDGAPLVGWCGTPPSPLPGIGLRFDGEPVPLPAIPSEDRVYDGDPIPHPMDPTHPAFDGRPVPFPAIPEGPAFVGDEVRLFPADPEFGVDGRTSFEVTAGGGIEELAVVDEQSG